MTRDALASFVSPSPDATAAFARRLAPSLGPGDVLCLEGPLGAGKTHFARALISEITGETDIPSPTFTLVQTYAGPSCDVWHADLYRLADASEVNELGLDAAFETAITLVEWPDRLSPAPDALWLHLTPLGDPDARKVTIYGSNRWAGRIADAVSEFSADA